MNVFQIQPLGFLFLGVCGVIMSLAVLWSEVTASTFLSAYAQLIAGLGESHQVFQRQKVEEGEE